MARTYKIIEICGDWALRIKEPREDHVFLYFKSRNNAELVKAILEWEDAHPNEASPYTLTLPNEWISVEDRLPELPDKDYCWVMVLACKKTSKNSMPMFYERQLVRKQRVERWKYYWDRIADELPDYWMSLPEPPEE